MRDRLEAALSADAMQWWSAALERVGGDDPNALPELFPQLVRRVGRACLASRPGPPRTAGDANASVIDLGAWRACDAAGAVLLNEAKPDDASIVDLHQHGDLEERTIVLRSLAVRPITDATMRLLEEAQRTNTVTHFEAAACDSNLAVRAADIDAFGQGGFNRLVLKAAFVDLAIDRLFDVETRANPDLSRMLQDLATEREAAGRSVWSGTNRLIAYAPVEGTTARLLGGLEHGDDMVRLTAAEGLAQLNRKDLQPFARERLAREPRQAIRDALQRVIDT